MIGIRVTLAGFSGNEETKKDVVFYDVVKMSSRCQKKMSFSMTRNEETKKDVVFYDVVKMSSRCQKKMSSSMTRCKKQWMNVKRLVCFFD